MCVNKWHSWGRSSTKFCRLDNEKLFWLGEILAWKWRLSFWVGCKLCCFRLVTTTLFWRQNRILFREFVLEKRFGRRPASRIRKIYLDLQVQNQLFLNFAYSTRAVHEREKIMQKSGLHNHHPDGSLKIVWYFPLWLIYRLVHVNSQPRSQGSLSCIMKIPAPSAENKRDGKLLSGPDRVTFSQRQLFTSSSPPLFMAPRCWESRDQPQPCRNQGSFSKARERTLGTRLATQQNALLWRHLKLSCEWYV